MVGVVTIMILFAGKALGWRDALASQQTTQRHQWVKSASLLRVTCTPDW